jgi:hypothetical protein
MVAKWLSGWWVLLRRWCWFNINLSGILSHFTMMLTFACSMMADCYSLLHDPLQSTNTQYFHFWMGVFWAHCSCWPYLDSLNVICLCHCTFSGINFLCLWMCACQPVLLPQLVQISPGIRKKMVKICLCYFCISSLHQYFCIQSNYFCIQSGPIITKVIRSAENGIQYQYFGQYMPLRPSIQK